MSSPWPICPKGSGAYWWQKAGAALGVAALAYTAYAAYTAPPCVQADPCGVRLRGEYFLPCGGGSIASSIRRITPTRSSS